MIDVERWVPWSELRSYGVLDREAILACLEEGRLGEPARRVDLEGVRILARLQGLPSRELNDHLFDRDNFLDFAMIILDMDDTFGAQMAPLDTSELKDKV